MGTTTVGEALSAEELAAWRGLLRVHAAVVARLDSELEAEHGLPVTAYDVLVNLAEAEGERMRMGDLADAVLLSRSGVSRLVDRLARDGLVGRCSCPSDARGAFAVLTGEGRALLERARPLHHEGVRRRFLAHFAPGELRELAEYWQRVLPGAADA